MKHKSRFRKEEDQELEHTHFQKQSKETTRDFESIEELLRFDASKTEVPPGLEKQVRRSLQREPKRSWWNRVFGGDE